MCGIAGWIDFERSEYDRVEILNRMTASLAHRGPDASGHWLDDNAAIGHRRLSIIDLANGVQPMVLDNDKQHLVVTFNGEIFNFREIRSTLIHKGHQFRTHSDTEVLLHGFLEWGAGIAERLNGMFAIALWDATNKELFLLRDRMGVKPLFYSVQNGLVVFGSEIKALAQHPRVRLRVGRDGMCEILDMVKTPEMTPYKGIFEVRPGSYHRIGSTTHTRSTYWRLEASPHHHGRIETIDRVRELLVDAVELQMIADVPVCSLLSGGLDSSAVTAIGAGFASGHQLASFSVDFQHNVDTFSADGLRQAADAPYARALADHVGTEHTELLLRSDAMLDPLTRSRVLRSVDAPPSYWGDMWPSLYLLFSQLSEHSKVALSGEAADEVFGGYQWFRNPAAVHGDTFPWLTPGSARYFGGTQLLSTDLMARLDRDGYRRARYDEALGEVPGLDGETRDERAFRRVSYLALTRFVQTLLDRNDRMSMAAGVEVRVPYCDHRLVQYAFNVPPALKSFDGREKSLLREAARPMLPSVVADRVKTPYPATQDGRYEAGLRDELRQVIGNPNAPVRDLIDVQKANGLLAREITTTSQPYNRGGLEMLLWLNRWLSEYPISLEIDEQANA